MDHRGLGEGNRMGFWTENRQEQRAGNQIDYKDHPTPGHFAPFP